jgi:hypothetical protein
MKWITRQAKRTVDPRSFSNGACGRVAVAELNVQQLEVYEISLNPAILARWPRLQAEPGRGKYPVEVFIAALGSLPRAFLWWRIFAQSHRVSSFGETVAASLESSR